MSIQLDSNNISDCCSDDSSVDKKDKLVYNSTRTSWSIFHRLTHWLKMMKHGVVDKKPEVGSVIWIWINNTFSFA